MCHDADDDEEEGERRTRERKWRRFSFHFYSLCFGIFLVASVLLPSHVVWNLTFNNVLCGIMLKILSQICAHKHTYLYIEKEFQGIFFLHSVKSKMRRLTWMRRIKIDKLTAMVESAQKGESIRHYNIFFSLSLLQRWLMDLKEHKHFILFQIAVFLDFFFAVYSLSCDSDFLNIFI